MAEQIEIEGFDEAKEDYVNQRNEMIKKLTSFVYGQLETLELAKSDCKLSLSAAFEQAGVSKLDAKAITDVAKAQLADKVEEKSTEAALFVEISGM